MIELENLKIEQEQKRKQNSLLKEAKMKYLLMQANRKSSQVANQQTLLQVLQGVVKQAEKYAVNYLYKKYYYRVNTEHLEEHEFSPKHLKSMQFPEGGNLNICLRRCKSHGTSTRSPLGVS